MKARGAGGRAGETDAGARELPSAETARDLIAALLGNASDLVADARLLLANQRFARAYALAVLASEELGKTYLCLQIALGDPTLDARGFWTGWRHHGEKLEAAWAYHTAFLAQLDQVDFDRLCEPPQRMRVDKMSAFYVDLDDEVVRTPQAIHPGAARQMVDVAGAAIDHAAETFGLLTNKLLPHLAALAPIFDQALDRVVDERQPASTLSTLRQLLQASLTDDIDTLLAILAPQGGEQDMPGGPDAG